MAKATLILKKPIYRVELDVNENSLEVVGYAKVVQCKDCKHYKPSEVDPNRKMCWRKDVDGWFAVCYDFYPTDFCSYGERRENDAETQSDCFRH